VNFRISYFTSNAGWSPTYDVRVSDIGQPVDLSYKANVYQQTGIDWNNVTLSISSAQPMAVQTYPLFSLFTWALNNRGHKPNFKPNKSYPPGKKVLRMPKWLR